MKRKYFWLIILLGGALSASILHARVFSSRNVDLLNPSSYGRLIYKTLMEINEGQSEVSVVICDDGLAPVEAALTAYHNPVFSAVAVHTEADKPALLVTVVKSPADQKASLTSRPRHRLVDVPVPADGVVLGTMRSADTRTTFEHLSSRMAKDETLRFFDLGMVQAGWVKQVGMEKGSGLSVYSKGTDICLILVNTQESNGETGITLLHKQGAVN